MLSERFSSHEAAELGVPTAVLFFFATIGLASAIISLRHDRCRIAAEAWRKTSKHVS